MSPDALEAFDILRELSSEDLALLAQFLEERAVEEGASLFWCGEESAELLLLVEGCVQLEREGEDLGALGSGGVLGCASLVRIGARACDARAAAPARLLALTRESYLRLRAEHPHIALALQEGILSSFAGSVHASIET